MHLALVQDDIHQPKEFNFFIRFDQLLIVIIDISLELSVEIGFNY